MSENTKPAAPASQDDFVSYLTSLVDGSEEIVNETVAYFVDVYKTSRDEYREFAKKAMEHEQQHQGAKLQMARLEGVIQQATESIRKFRSHT